MSSIRNNSATNNTPGVRFACVERARGSSLSFARAQAVGGYCGGVYSLKTSAALCPPNPRLSEIAARGFSTRTAWFGT